MIVDHYMNAMGASAYRDISTLTNALEPDRKAMGLSDAPITRRFIRDTRRGSSSAADFWELASTADGSLTRAAQTYKAFIEQGREAAAERFLQEQDPDHQAYALLDTHFKAEAKRLHPMYRARQVTSIVSGMRREMNSEMGLERISKTDPGKIEITSTQKRRVDTLLSELSRREVRNALVAGNVPGWGDKKPLDVMTTIDMIEAEMPEVAEELRARATKAKLYPEEFVREAWPDVRERVLMHREDAILTDVLQGAKAYLSIGAYQR